jgi:uncharacterized Zn finger protein (UPF0148 family)
MQKYGVDETPSLNRKYGETDLDVCPLCGARLQKHGHVVLCPTHGSEPFEHDDKQT